MSEIPSMHELFRPCLELLSDGATNARQCLPGIQKRYGLTEDQMAETIPSGQRTRVLDRADWAIFHLMHAGLIERPQRGVSHIAPAGRDALRSAATVDWGYVSTRPAYMAWKSSRKGSEARNGETGQPVASMAAGNSSTDAGALSSGLTPPEAIDLAYREIEHQLAEDLREQVLTLTPARFEQLIVELLLAMGYGDGRAEMGRAIGKSGDGGIDGVVNEDKLGLDAVYIQAKRYAPDNTVGRPALQAFIGSMTGESATKGVFVTTSGFSREAREFVQRVQQRVVLIDGSRLARLMIDHGVGVRVDKTYVLRSIDANFFDPI